MCARRHGSQRAQAAVVAFAVAALLAGVLLALGLPTAADANAAGPATQSGQTAPSSGTCPASNPPDELLLVDGTPQTAQLDATFANTLQVTLANTNGCPVNPVAGTPVTFTAPASGASAGFAASGTSTVTVGADSSGNASAGTLTADDTPGSYTVIAQSAYGSVSFALTNTASGIPARVVAVSPITQRAIAGSRYKNPLAVRVLDAGGHPISGVTVTFAVPGGADGGSYGSGGSRAGATFAGGSSTTTAKTGSRGVATSPPLAANQSAGSFAAFASVAHVSRPARFQLLNQPARGLRLTRIGRARRTAAVGRAYRARLRVRVRNAHGGPVVGLRVTFALATGVSSGSGQVTGAPGARASFPGGITQVSETTSANGIAVSPRLTANATAGSFTATASTTAGNSIATFRLSNRPAPAASLAVGAGATQAATVGTPFLIPLAVTVTDAYGNPVPDARVTFTAPEAGASCSFKGHRTSTVRTNRHGVAVAPPSTANRAPGGYIVTARTGRAPLVAFALVNQRR